MRAKDVLGRRGEDAAARYLADRLGWVILDRNWRHDGGELDIVARDGPDLVACEVKTRSTTTYGTPVEAVTEIKAARLYRLAVAWLAAHDYAGLTVRVDVVGLVVDGPDHFIIDHLKGVC